MKFFCKILIFFFLCGLASCKSVPVPTEQPQQVQIPGAYERAVTITDYDSTQRGAHLVFVPYEYTFQAAMRLTTCYLRDGDRLYWVGSSQQELPMGIYDVHVSPDSRYIAFSVSGEGHPWVEIYELQPLIQENKTVYLADLQPYPGYIEVVGWEEDWILFKSDLPFDRKFANDSTLTYESLQDPPATYRYHVVSKKLEKQ